MVDIPNYYNISFEISESIILIFLNTWIFGKEVFCFALVHYSLLGFELSQHSFDFLILIFCAFRCDPNFAGVSCRSIGELKNNKWIC